MRTPGDSAPDPRWAGRQPRWTKLVQLGPMRFGLVHTAASGERRVTELRRAINRPLGRS